MATTIAASRKHVELSLELKRKLIHEHECGVPFTMLGKKYHIATSTAANIWRKKDFFLRSRMSGSRKRCNDRSKYKIVNQVTALFVKCMLERKHKIDGEVIKRFARSAALQCNFKDFHGSNGWLDSFKKRENVCWVRRRGAASGQAGGQSGEGASTSGEPEQFQCRSNSPNLCAVAAAAAALLATTHDDDHQEHQQQASAHHHHNHLHFGHQELGPRAYEPANSANASPRHLGWDSDNEHHHPEASGAESHPLPAHEGGLAGAHEAAALAESGVQSAGGQCAAAGPSGECARCSVAAAAAAAVAALSSGGADQVHERDHEIEDWFHGIPFLCYFFEEYQSMHQQPAAAAGQPPGGCPQQQAALAPQQQQPLAFQLQGELQHHLLSDDYHHQHNQMMGQQQQPLMPPTSATTTADMQLQLPLQRACSANQLDRQPSLTSNSSQQSLDEQQLDYQHQRPPGQRAAEFQYPSMEEEMIEQEQLQPQQQQPLNHQLDLREMRERPPQSTFKVEYRHHSNHSSHHQLDQLEPETAQDQRPPPDYQRHRQQADYQQHQPQSLEVECHQQQYQAQQEQQQQQLNNCLSASTSVISLNEEPLNVCEQMQQLEHQINCMCDEANPHNCHQQQPQQSPLATGTNSAMVVASMPISSASSSCSCLCDCSHSMDCSPMIQLRPQQPGERQLAEQQQQSQCCSSWPVMNHYYS